MLALAALAALSASGAALASDLTYNQSTEYSSGAYGSGPYETYYSSDITPNVWNFAVPLNSSTEALAAPGYVFGSARCVGGLWSQTTGTDCVQPGAVIHDQAGGLVYSAYEVAGQTMSFERTTYQGNDVIVVWTGSFNSAGFGFGRNLILSNTYEVVANFTTLDIDALADFHDVQITTNDTALMTAYVITSADLSNYTDGLTDGWIATGHFQELDIATNAVLFSWSALDYLDPADSYATPGSTGTSESDPWDWFHINSVDKDAAGNYLVSSRHMHAVYYVSGASGEVLWTLGGNNSSFTSTSDDANATTFYWQHDARWRANQTQISLFDNAATSWESDAEYARALLLDVDLDAMTVGLATEFLPYNRTVSPSQGNIQLLEDGNGNAIVGWGQTPRWSEFTADGTLILDVQFGVGNVQSYRAYKSAWTAYPTTLPSVAVFPNGTDAVYVSWNGATEVATWALYGSNDASTTEAISNTTKSGFETALNASSTTAYSYYQVVGLDASAEILGYSAFTAADGSTVAPAANQTAEVTANSTASATASGVTTSATGTTDSSAGKTVAGSVAALVGTLCVVAAAAF